MIESAKTLIHKATGDLSLSLIIVNNELQHDNCGYHLSQAVEKLLKALCELKGLRYAKNGKHGHQLDLLLSIVDDCGEYSFIGDYWDILDLEVYGSASRYDYVMDSERLDLAKYYGLVASFRIEVLREFKKALR